MATPSTASAEPSPAADTQHDIAALVAEGAKLAPAIEKLKKKEKRLDEIKAILREKAGDAVTHFKGTNGEIATVMPVRDTVVRSVPEDLLEKVREMAGRRIWTLFKLAPCKEFEFTALKTLPKELAAKLVKLLTTSSSARVSFIGGSQAA